jgi:hypothetical protein
VKLPFIKVSSFICLILFSLSVIAEDVLIIHEGYANTHIKWKNRLEDSSGGNHTVTSVNITSASFPTDTSSYEQIYDIRYSNSYTMTSSLQTHYKALLARGGTLYLQTEHTSFGTRNNSVIDFIEDELGGGTITYGSSNAGNSINTHNSSESWLSSFSGTLTFVAAGKLSAIGNGTWIAKDSSGNIVAAVWYGSQLSSSYSGKVIVVTDINYASHSSYYTNTNKNWMNAMRTMLASTYNTTPTSGITSTQQTKVTTTQGTSQSNNKIYINQSGSGVELNITQDGDDNLVIGPDLSAAGQITGDNIELTITQTNDNNIIGIDIDGNANDVDITQNLNQSALIDITGASNTLNLNQTHLSNSGEHYADITIVGNSNVMDIDQTESGDKILFLDVDGSNNVTVDQKGTGDHFLDITLTDSHTLDITQDGSGDHSGTLNLSGNNTSITLTQDSSSDQNYYLSQNCTNTSCSATVTQN